jgi:hypothetical protein
LEPEDLDQIFWMRRDIQILNAGLKNYVTQLIALLGAERYIRELDERLEEIENRRQARPLTIGGKV